MKKNKKKNKKKQNNPPPIPSEGSDDNAESEPVESEAESKREEVAYAGAEKYIDTVVEKLAVQEAQHVKAIEDAIRARDQEHGERSKLQQQAWNDEKFVLMNEEKKKRDAAVAKAMAAKAEQYNTLAAHCKQKEQDASELHASEVAKLKAAHAAELQDAVQSAVKAEKDQNSKEKEEYTSDQQQKTNTEARDVRRKHASKVKSLEEQIAQLVAAQQESSTNVADLVNENLKANNETHLAEIEDLKQEHSTTLKALQKDYAELEKRHKSRKIAHQDDLANKEQLYTAALALEEKKRVELVTSLLANLFLNFLVYTTIFKCTVIDNTTLTLRRKHCKKNASRQ